VALFTFFFKAFKPFKVDFFKPFLEAFLGVGVTGVLVLE